MNNDKLPQLQNAIISGNIPQLVLTTLGYAVESGASDIHIEPLESTVRIRFRIDGVLRRIVEYPPNMHPAVVSRLKIMSNLKIDEQRIPQDGRISTETENGKELDLRVSSLPTVHGEKIVMRIVDKSKKIPTLDSLGIEGKNYDILLKAIQAPNGICLTSGPTGSGKSTTLYAALQMLNEPDVNIMTLEDPVENQVDGLNQSQMHPEIGYNFAYGLRTALRQDPDIIMVGEIRDKETIDIAIEASLTGHLVLSTIHTNSAAETITRVLNMGIQNFLITATFNCIIAQRLVRKICESCKAPTQLNPELQGFVNETIKRIPPDEAARRLPPEILTAPVLYQGKGCDVCEGSGYKGRIGIYEILETTDAVKDMVIQKLPAIQIHKNALELGMISLELDGMIKALQGMTTIEEIYQVARKDIQ